MVRFYKKSDLKKRRFSSVDLLKKRGVDLLNSVRKHGEEVMESLFCRRQTINTSNKTVSVTFPDPKTKDLVYNFIVKG